MTEASKPSPTPGWAEATGVVSIGASAFVLDETGLVDRFNILETIARYTWAYDERHTEAMTSCFTPDASWEGTIAGVTKISS